MSKRKAFTLIELLVVVSIIALLVSILLPALGKARQQARRTMCMTGLHAMVNGVHTYAADYDEFPANYANKDACAKAAYGYLPYYTKSVEVLVSSKYVPGFEVFKCPWVEGGRRNGFYESAVESGAVHDSSSGPELDGMPRRMDYIYMGGSFVTPGGYAPSPQWARGVEANPEKTLFADYCNMGYNYSIAGNHGPKGFCWDERINQGSFVANIRGNVAWKDEEFWRTNGIQDYWWKFGNSYYFCW